MGQRADGQMRNLPILSQYLAGIFQNLRGFTALRAVLVIGLMADEAKGEIEVEPFEWTYDGGDKPDTHADHRSPLPEKTRQPASYVSYICSRMGLLVPELIRDLRTILAKRGPAAVRRELFNDLQAAAYRIAFDLEAKVNALRTPATSPFTDGTYADLSGTGTTIDAAAADPAEGLRKLQMAYIDSKGLAADAVMVPQRLLDALAISAGIRDYLPTTANRNLAEDAQVIELIGRGLRVDRGHVYVCDGYKTTNAAWSAPSGFAKVHPNQIFLYNRGTPQMVGAAREQGAVRIAGGAMSLATFVIDQNIPSAVTFGDTGLTAVPADGAVEVLNNPGVRVFRARQEVKSNPDLVKVGGEIEATVAAIMPSRTGLIATDVLSASMFGS